MLSSKEIICPEKLLNLAKTKGPVKVVIVNAGKAVSIESTKQAFDEGLIEPVFIGDKKIIEKLANEIKWDISKFEIIDEPVENNTAPIAAKMASEGKIKIIGVGGVDSGQAAYDKFIAGADFVQLYTGMVFKGPNIAGIIKKDLKELLIRDGVKNYTEIVIILFQLKHHKLLDLMIFIIYQ